MQPRFLLKLISRFGFIVRIYVYTKGTLQKLFFVLVNGARREHSRSEFLYRPLREPELRVCFLRAGALLFAEIRID